MKTLITLIVFAFIYTVNALNKRAVTAEVQKCVNTLERLHINLDTYVQNLHASNQNEDNILKVDKKIQNDVGNLLDISYMDCCKKRNELKIEDITYIVRKINKDIESYGSLFMTYLDIKKKFKNAWYIKDEVIMFGDRTSYLINCIFDFAAADGDIDSELFATMLGNFNGLRLTIGQTEKVYSFLRRN